MRFAGNSSNTNSFIAAGKAAAQGAENLFKVARENSPDYGMLATENMKARSKERQVATAAEAAVRREGIKALTQVKKTGIQVDAKEKILGMKLDANRKAGIVGALGAVAGGGLMAVENNRAKKLQAERDAAADARDAQSLAIQEGLINSYSQYTPAEFDKNNPEHNPGWKGGSTTSKPSGDNPNAPAVNSNGAVSKGRAWNALSSVIRTVEGTLGDKGYTTRFGGYQFSDLSAHPNIAAPTPWGTKSEAAGAYQFMKPTWDEAKAALGLKDFSVDSQERAGQFLTKRRGVQIDKPFNSFEEFSSAITKLSPEWAGLPSSTKGRTGYHGQANADMNELWQIYQQNL